MKKNLSISQYQPISSIILVLPYQKGDVPVALRPHQGKAVASESEEWSPTSSGGMPLSLPLRLNPDGVTMTQDLLYSE